VRVGVRGSEGVVRECVGPWEMRHALGMRHLGCGVEFPHWDLPLTPCHL
jgi:hypothetical protein